MFIKWKYIHYIYIILGSGIGFQLPESRQNKVLSTFSTEFSTSRYQHKICMGRNLSEISLLEQLLAILMTSPHILYSIFGSSITTACALSTRYTP